MEGPEGVGGSMSGGGGWGSSSGRGSAAWDVSAGVDTLDGSKESEANDWAVRPTGAPPSPLVTITIPDAK
jgi:hypothetical protein